MKSRELKNEIQNGHYEFSFWDFESDVNPNIHENPPSPTPPGITNHQVRHTWH